MGGLGVASRRWMISQQGEGRSIGGGGGIGG